MHLIAISLVILQIIVKVSSVDNSTKLAIFNAPIIKEIFECPVLRPGQVGPCIEMCNPFNQCRFGLCCFNGCGHTCQSNSKERERESERK
jgi:hypothetical protein